MVPPWCRRLMAGRLYQGLRANGVLGAGDRGFGRRLVFAAIGEYTSQPTVGRSDERDR